MRGVASPEEGRDVNMTWSYGLLRMPSTGCFEFELRRGLGSQRTSHIC